MAICYRDRSYCGSKDCKNDCGRKITEEEAKHAKELDLPIAYMCFCGDEWIQPFDQMAE